MNSTLSVVDRARRYVQAMDAAISGQRGHDATFAVACVLVNGFALPESDALTVMLEYNGRCSPAWAERELLHKIRSAATARHDKPRGHLLGDDVPVQSPRRRRSPEEIKRDQIANDKVRLAARAKSAKVQLLEKFNVGFVHYGKTSPIKLIDRDPRDDWKLLLQLYQPDDVLWIGTKKNESANADHDPAWIAYCKTRFRSVTDWLKETNCPGILLTPGTFKPGSFSRCDSNIVSRPFLVVESDTLNRVEVCAVFRWMEQHARLRAIVDTSGRSLHGWFDMPPAPLLAELETILPALECDKALFGKSQPVRLPGGLRPETNIVQSLLYLDL